MKSCSKAAALTSESQDRRLTPSEFIGLWIHRALCAPCRIYRRQLKTLTREAARLQEVTSVQHEIEDDAKARIRARLRAATANPNED